MTGGSSEHAQLKAARDLARAVRGLADTVIRMPAGPATAGFAANIDALVDGESAALRDSWVPWYYDDPRTTRRRDRQKEGVGTGDELSDFNPMIPPMRLRVHEDVLSGSVVVGPAFTGPPGLVHGGTQSTMLDHTMGLLVAGTGRTAVTARLEVDFRRGAPVGSELELTARIESIEGRKVRVQGEIRFGGETCAHGRALFVVVDPQQEG